MKILLMILLLITPFLILSQEKTLVRTFDSVYCSTKLNTLKMAADFNKAIPEKYQLSVYIALSFFPELDSTRIIFKDSKIKTTLNARPTLWSLIFRKKENRKYIVRINNRQADSSVTINKVPFNASIGLFGHEFSHFIDYSKKNIFQVIGRAISYSSQKKKEKFEKEIDLITIKKGLGWQLYDWSYFVLNHSDATKKYKAFKELVYLEPQEIKMILSKYNQYNNEN